MKFQDYIYLYLGCQHRYHWKEGAWSVWCELTPSRLDKVLNNASIDKVELSLRPLSDMTEEEKSHISFDAYGVLRSEQKGLVLPSGQMSMMWAAKQTYYLLSKHFDLFGLIKAGLAIDSTKQKGEAI